MIATVTHIGLRTTERKTAGQLAYEAAGKWVAEHDAAPKPRPTWDLLDAHGREYWDRVGAAAREPLIIAINAFVECEKNRPTREALANMLVGAGLSSACAIRGLW